MVSTFNKNFTGKFGRESVSDVLRESLLKGNDALSESIKETPALEGMGCTMVTAAFNRGKVFWVSVGDSHLYLIRDRELVKRNEDHSYGGYLDRMKAQGVEVDAEAGLSRNMLMSAMTGDEIAEIDCPDDGLQLLPGDRVVVASDGLDTLTEARIIQTSSWHKAPKDCVQALLNAVDEEKKPRQDNTTVVVVDVHQQAAAPLPAGPAIDEPAKAAAAPRMAPAENFEQGYERDSASRGRGKSVLAGLVVGLFVLIGVGAGYWFMIGPGKDSGQIRQWPKDDVVKKSKKNPGTDTSGGQEPATSGKGDGTAEGATTAGSGELSDTDTGASGGTASGSNGTAGSGASSGGVQSGSGAPASATGGTNSANREFQDNLSQGGQGPEMVELAAGSFAWAAVVCQSTSMSDLGATFKSMPSQLESTRLRTLSTQLLPERQGGACRTPIVRTRTTTRLFM